MEPIAGRLSILVLEAEGDPEEESSVSLVTALRRRGLAVHDESAARLDESGALSGSAFVNCVLIIGRGAARRSGVSPPLLPSLLVLAGVVARAEEASAPPAPTREFPAIVRARSDGASARGLRLFLVKFLYELDLHCPEAISAEMLRFAHFKALRIVRRRYPGVSATLRIVDG